jgi:hypothetical protein
VLQIKLEQHGQAEERDHKSATKSRVYTQRCDVQMPSW